MQLQQIEIDCQSPPNGNFIRSKHSIIQCSISKNSEAYGILLQRARELAQMVNPAAANDADLKREDSRLLQDAFGGVLAEAGWLQYINTEFGDVASPTAYTTAMHQIDIRLSNGEFAEVRSSFPRNGVKFALCYGKKGFNNIGPYSNSVKPGEVQKHLYLGVLFETQKGKLLIDSQVSFSLVGGSTWEMMVERGRDENLVPEGGFTQNQSAYKVIEFQFALDSSGVIEAIEALGYSRAQRT